MMKNSKPYTGGQRVRKAYATAIRVLLSYSWLLLGKKIFGQAYYDKRIMALHLRNAQKVKNAIIELKGLFIKVGQMLSILSNFLPEAFQKPLEELQDHVPPRPMEQVRDRFLREFGKMPEEMFARFDETPLAAASIGQVHRAQLPDGTEIVVKIQHADIEEVAQIDLQVILRITRLISWFYQIQGMGYLYTQVRKMIEDELDFKQEARAMTKIAQNLANEPGVKVPLVYEAYSTSRILTSGWSDGIKISNTEQLEQWGLNRNDIARNLLKAYCKMLFVDGYYHADPHPGNILVEKSGDIVLLDFGAVGQLSAAMQEGIPRLIEAAVRNDTQAMIDTFRNMGFLTEGREAQQMAEKMINALRNFLQNEVQFEGLNFKEIKVNPLDNSLINLLRDVGLNGIAGTVQVPKDYVLLNRMLTLLLGLCNTLAPELNPLDVVRPYAQEFVMGEKGDTLTYIKNFLKNSLSNALALPDELRTVLQKTRSGQLEMLNPDVRDSARLLYLAIHQVLFVLLSAGSATAAWYWSDQYDVRLLWVAAACFTFLLLRAFRKGERLFNKL